MKKLIDKLMVLIGRKLSDTKISLANTLAESPSYQNGFSGGIHKNKQKRVLIWYNLSEDKTQIIKTERIEKLASPPNNYDFLRIVKSIYDRNGYLLARST